MDTIFPGGKNNLWTLSQPKNKEVIGQEEVNESELRLTIKAVLIKAMIGPGEAFMNED